MILNKITFLKQNSEQSKNKQRTVALGEISKNETLNFKTLINIKIESITKKTNIAELVLFLQKKKINFLNRKYLKQNSHKTNKQIHYLFIITVNHSNTFFNVISYLDDEQLPTQSLGKTKFKSLDKISKKYLIIQNLQQLNEQLKTGTNISVRICSTNHIFNRLILNFLKNFYIIQKIEFINNLPHNGCRQKKKRRK